MNTSRRDRTDLLTRPPWHATMYQAPWDELFVDPADQLIALGDLVARGLLTPDEFERQKAKVIGRR